MFTAARALSAIPGEQLYYSYTYGAPVEWMTLEGYDRAEHILLSYDVSGLARHQAARACHIVFGRRRRDGSKGDRIEPGLIHRPGGAGGRGGLGVTSGASSTWAATRSASRRTASGRSCSSRTRCGNGTPSGSTASRRMWTTCSASARRG